jgi:hypothetical protein
LAGHLDIVDELEFAWFTGVPGRLVGGKEFVDDQD